MTTYNTKIVQEQGGDKLRIRSGGTLQIESGASVTRADGTRGGTILSASGLTGDIQHLGGDLYRAVLTFAGVSVTMTDAGAAGCHGTLRLLTHAEGIQCYLMASVNLSITAGAGGIADDASLIGAIGIDPVGTDNATLTSNEINLIASTACTLSGGVGVFRKGGPGIPFTSDRVSGAPGLSLNFAVPDAGSSASDTLSLTGTIEFLYATGIDW